MQRVLERLKNKQNVFSLNFQQLIAITESLQKVEPS